MKDYKIWLDQLPEKVIRASKKSIRPIIHITKTYKKSLVVGICVTSLLGSIHTGVIKADENSKHNVEKIYHVYVDGDRVGSVEDDKLVTSLVNSKLEEFNSSFQDHSLVLGQELKLIPEIVFTSRATTTSTLSELDSKLSVKAEAIALVVDGQEISYVSNEGDYKEVLENLMLQYVSKEEIASVLDAKENNSLLKEPELGEKVILDLKLSKEIEIKKATVTPNQILSVEDAVKQLNLGTLEDDIYIVQPGDVLGTIAQAHGLKTKEILALNPSITENTLLQIGDELNVTIYEPIVKVIVEEKTMVKEEIPFETETKEDATMWKGDTKVQQEGKDGERIVSYSITRENGRTVQKHIVSENVTKEPVKRIVLRGTKVSSSRGSGNLAWPAVGGYISSYQGTRWGKFHKGIDIARPSNKNILAADNGKVTFVGWDGGYGNKVVINHNNGMETVYAHLSSMSVKIGQTVPKGKVIGKMGSTGNSTGTHLHFEVYKNGNLKNPMDYYNR